MSPPQMPLQRNLVLGDTDGNILAGFYQYGTVSWKKLFDWLSLLFATSERYIIVGTDRPTAEQYLPTSAIVAPGKYLVLAADWSPIAIKLVSTHALPQLSTLCRERTSRLDLQSRARHRNCQAAGDGLAWCRLQAAHIFSATRPAHEDAPDDAGDGETRPAMATRGPGGSAKPRSLRNMLFLREDLHDAWADYEFSIDPDDEYRIVAFVSGHDALAGQYVEMRAMAAPGTRPFDALLRAHLAQGVLKHVKGRGERHWDFASGAMDLSDAGLWGGAEAKGRLEREFGNRLDDGPGGSKGTSKHTSKNTSKGSSKHTSGGGSEGTRG